MHNCNQRAYLTFCRNLTKDFLTKCNSFTVYRDQYLRRINKTIRDSLAEGHAEGLAESHASMQTRLNKLIIMLAGQNRTEELIMAAQDTAFQQQLLEEFGI